MKYTIPSISKTIMTKLSFYPVLVLTELSVVISDSRLTISKAHANNNAKGKPMMLKKKIAVFIHPSMVMYF